VSVLGLGRGVVGIGVGFLSSCAVTLAGGVRCWGANSAGQLGDGTDVDRRRPATVVGFGLRASVIIATGSVRVDGRGLARIGLRCGAPVACRGTLLVKRRSMILGHHGFSIVAGHRAVVPVRLTARAFALVRRAGRLQALGQARVRQPDDAPTTAVRALTLIAPPR